MSLLTRLTLVRDTEPDPEDILGSALGVIFPDDVANQHGDHNTTLLYTSPHLPRPLSLRLSEPKGDEDRKLFSHYLWNSSLQLAHLVEAGTLGLEPGPELDSDIASPSSDFDVAGLSTIELGAGSALPSLMSALLGARRVVVTDYPAPEILETLRKCVATLIQPQFSPLGQIAALEEPSRGEQVETLADEGKRNEEQDQGRRRRTGGGIEVQGHGWGELSGEWEQENRHAFDRVFAADCLWMPWQHENLRASIDWFLAKGVEARAWVVAGFHTGRANMRGFFDAEGLKRHGLVVERIWERDCNGVDREWAWDRGTEDITERKRWLVIAVLKREVGECQ